MEPIEISILIKRARITQYQIAKNLGVTQGFVGQVILGLRHTKRVREAIADAVGKPVEKLWPRTTSDARQSPNSKRKAA